MARYFNQHGWKDITIAFPYNPLECMEISELARRCSINILIESTESLVHANATIDSPVGYFIKIDVGTHRTGVDYHNKKLIEKLVSSSNEKIKFKGFLAHAGHTYAAKDTGTIRHIFDKSGTILGTLRENFGGITSYGDTPSCSIMKEFSMFDELRPGNFIFYDWMQYRIGSCHIKQIGVCFLCPVVAKHIERQELVIFGGAVHFSMDTVTDGEERSFGKIVALTPNGWGTDIIGNVDRLSQEHGIVKMSKERIVRTKVGDMVGVIPIHSCLSADLQGYYLSTEGNRIDKNIKN